LTGADALAALTASMKAKTLEGSFLMPSVPAIPLATSTASGRKIDIARPTFSGFSPPARSQPLFVQIGGTLKLFHANADPLQSKTRVSTFRANPLKSYLFLNDLGNLILSI
jgi:hypothetical protein